MVEAFYPGQLGGQALAEILFGDVNPSGKLPITMEKRAQDNPAYATFPNPVNQHPDSLNYSEAFLSAIADMTTMEFSRSSHSGSACPIRRSRFRT